MCGSRPLLGLKSRVGIGPDCLPNHELSVLCVRITLGHFPVGHGCEPVQGNRHYAFLHSSVSVSFPALFLRGGVLSPSFLFPSGVDWLQIRFCDVHRRFVFELLGLQPQRPCDGKRMGR